MNGPSLAYEHQALPDALASPMAGGTGKRARVDCFITTFAQSSAVDVLCGFSPKVTIDATQGLHLFYALPESLNRSASILDPDGTFSQFILHREAEVACELTPAGLYLCLVADARD